jgi:hypothetical protein
MMSSDDDQEEAAEDVCVEGDAFWQYALTNETRRCRDIACHLMFICSGSKKPPCHRRTRSLTLRIPLDEVECITAALRQQPPSTCCTYHPLQLEGIPFGE